MGDFVLVDASRYVPESDVDATAEVGVMSAAVVLTSPKSSRGWRLYAPVGVGPRTARLATVTLHK